MEFNFENKKYRVTPQLNKKERYYVGAYDTFNEPIIVERFDINNIPGENVLGYGTFLEVFCESCSKWMDYYKKYISSSLNRCCEDCLKESDI